MRQLLIEVIAYNFQLFEQTPDADLSKICDVLESFYVFNTQVAKKIPQAFADVNIDCVKLIHFGKQLSLGNDLGLVPLTHTFVMSNCSDASNDSTGNRPIQTRCDVFATFHHAIAGIAKRNQCCVEEGRRGRSHHVAVHRHLHAADTRRHFRRYFRGV